MARHERAPRAVPAQPFSGPVRLQARRGPDGRPQIVQPERELIETIEAAERPPTPDDPRQGPFRAAPPLGGAG
jgi:hypothetical protein